MKIAVMSDIHGNLSALNRVVEDFKSQGASQVIVLGDIVFFGDEPEGCFQLIQELRPLAWIKGNTDDWINIMDEKCKSVKNENDHMHEEFQRFKGIMRPSSFEFIGDLPST